MASHPLIVDEQASVDGNSFDSDGAHVDCEFVLLSCAVLERGWGGESEQLALFSQIKTRRNAARGRRRPACGVIEPREDGDTVDKLRVT